MIPAKDIYVDKHDTITDDPTQYAAQVATAGCFLDDRVARRYGITDALVSVHEPDARRMVMGKPGRSKPSNNFTEPEPKASPDEETPDATAPEPEAEEAKTDEPAKKAEAEKGAKKK